MTGREQHHLDQWEAQLGEFDEPDKGFLWDPPQSFDEAQRRANAMLERLLYRLRKQTFEAGFDPVEPTPCEFCGGETVWRDPAGTVRHPGCPR